MFRLWLVFLLLGGNGLHLVAQAPSATRFGLEEAVDYARQNAPALRAERTAVEAARLNNELALAAWRPQVSVSGNLQHYFKLPVSLFPDFDDPESGELREVTLGPVNTSLLSGNVRQTIYSPAVVRALRAVDPSLRLAELTLREAEINLSAEVQRAYYLAVRQQERIRLLIADVERLERSLRDARLLYEEGIKDKVDYKRAQIALNTARTQLANARIARTTRTAELGRLLGYPATGTVELRYDTAQLATVFERPLPAPGRRIEERRISARDTLLGVTERFQRQSWLPAVEVSGTHNIVWQNNALSDLYRRTFPNTLGTLSFQMPLFRGGARFKELALTEVERHRLSLELAALRDRISLEYTTAYNAFERARNDYRAARANLDLAAEIYRVVDLQYREGIKPYLEVVIAETDLQRARLNRTDALLAALIARVAVERAAGTIR